MEFDVVAGVFDASVMPYLDDIYEADVVARVVVPEAYMLVVVEFVVVALPAIRFVTVAFVAVRPRNDPILAHSDDNMFRFVIDDVLIVVVPSVVVPDVSVFAVSDVAPNDEIVVVPSVVVPVIARFVDVAFVKVALTPIKFVIYEDKAVSSDPTYIFVDVAFVIVAFDVSDDEA